MDAIACIAGTDVPEFLGLRSENSALERARFLVLPVPFEQTTIYMSGLLPAALRPARLTAPSGGSSCGRWRRPT